MDCPDCSAPVTSSADCCPSCGALLPSPGAADPHGRRVVGLMGFSGVGKDEAAKGLEQLGWTRLAFSQPIEKVARHIGWDGNRNGEGRVLLQRLGNAVREFVDPDAWVRAAERAIDATPGDVVITGVRFPNEAEMIRHHGGVLVRIRRPGFERPVNDDVTEMAWHGIAADLVVENVRGSAELRRGLVDGVTALYGAMAGSNV